MTDSTDDILRDILRTLDEMKSVLILAHKDGLKKAKEALLPKDTIKEEIYELCDGTRSTSEVAGELGKSSGYVSSYLTILRREGLIRLSEKGAKTVHEQVF